MTVMQILFLVTAAVILLSAIMTVSDRNMLHSALWLVLSLLGVAVLFAMLELNFFAIVQVLVYIGAIAILILFSVMLSRDTMANHHQQNNRHWYLLAPVLVLFFALVVVSFFQWGKVFTPPPALPIQAADIAQLGKELVDPQGYLIPFEMTSILLLAALVGSIYTAVDGKEEKE